MKKNLSLVLLCCALTFQCHYSLAQKLSDEIVLKYSPGIVTQVFDLTMKTGIDEDTQKEIADLLLEKEIAIFAMFKDGFQNNAILAKKVEFDDQITALLNMEQKYNNYVKTKKEKAKDKFSYSQFAIAIRYRDSLNVSAEQYKSLLAAVETLKNLKNTYYETNKRPMDSRGYESENIAKILTVSQHRQMLQIKNYSKADAFARADWQEIVSRKISEEFKEEEAIKSLRDYYLVREITYNLLQHDLVAQKAEVRDLYTRRPTLLRTLQKLRRNTENDTATKIYKW